MYAHCNGVWVRFGGSYWLAETPLAVSVMGYLAGTMELLAADTARFVIDLRYIDPAVYPNLGEVIIYHQTTEDLRCM
jgi:hypothetical protein